MKEEMLTIEQLKCLKENVKEFCIDNNFGEYYYNYMVSTLIDRALPDVRDGLKPVHRRILYALDDLGITYDKPYKKCARIVGEVLGKYHPHGDSSVYDAMVRMGQEFSLNYPLISGHGNYGNEDGDSPAAMRYTEAKMNKITEEMLTDINKTVDFVPNFDGEEKEPVVLPSRFPNLLVNGCEGIATAYACKFPSHNLESAIDQTIHQIDFPNCSIMELVDILKAPDFSTGGTIVNPNDMVDLYTNGYGKIVIRSKYTIKDNTITITEIPYGVNKLKQVSNLILLSKGENKKVKNIKTGKMEDRKIEPKIPQIESVFDESNKRSGMRIVVNVKDGEDVNKVLKLIFKYTDLEYSYGANFNCVLGNKLLRNISLKDMNKYYIEHQKTVVLNRSKFDLDKALNRIHILEGLIIGINNMDEVVSIIKKSKDSKSAIETLMVTFNLSKTQATSIIEMKLKRFTGLEKDKLKNEKDELLITKEKLENIINNEKTLLEVIKKELNDIKEKYKRPRNTDIIYDDELLDIDLSRENIKDYNCSIAITNDGYIKKTQKHSDSHKLKENDFIIEEFKCNNKDTLFFFTNTGYRIKLSVNDLELKKPNTLGEYIPTLLSNILLEDEKIIKVIAVPQDAKGFIISTYENGNISKTPIDNYISNFTRKKNMFNTTKCGELLDLKYITKDEDVLFINSEGRGLIINTSTVKGNGNPSSQGVSGMKLTKDIKCVYSKIGITQDNHIELTNTNNETKEYLLDDIAPYTTTDKQLYEHLSYNTRGIQGNFIWNTRNNNYDIKSANIK